MFADQRVGGKGCDYAGQAAFHNGLGYGFEQPQSDGNSGECGEDQPGRAAEMDMTPVLHHRDEGNGDGSQDGYRRGDFHWNY